MLHNSKHIRNFEWGEYNISPLVKWLESVQDKDSIVIVTGYSFNDVLNQQGLTLERYRLGEGAVNPNGYDHSLAQTIAQNLKLNLDINGRPLLRGKHIFIFLKNYANVEPGDVRAYETIASNSGFVVGSNMPSFK